MHILIILLVVAALIYLFLQARGNAQRDASDAAAQTLGEHNTAPDLKLGFISKGKLFIRKEGSDVQQVHSDHIQKTIDRMERSKQLHGWKENTSLGTSFSGKQKHMGADQLDVRFSSALLNSDNKLLYFLKDANFGGLFEHDFEEGKEKRLLHKQQLDLQGLSLDATGEQLLCSRHYASGIANVALMAADGSATRELTAGDTVDTSPAWVSGENAVVYSSAGLARSQEGFVVAQGPAALQLLNLDSSEISPVLEDPRCDFLHPKVDSAGSLFFIRRPYEAKVYRSSHLLKDILLFPFRLARAVLHYLNFFSLMYSRKPLTSASGPEVEADLKDIILQGRRIDAENALRKEGTVRGVPSLVPKTWELVCKSRNGKERVLANNVASFDLTATDQVVYTNGYGIFLLDARGNPHLLLRDMLVNEVIV